jgi:hypothetical protein
MLDIYVLVTNHFVFSPFFRHWEGDCMIFGYVTKKLFVSLAGKALSAYKNLRAKVATPRLEVARTNFPDLAEKLDKLAFRLFVFGGPEVLCKGKELAGLTDCLMATTLRYLKESQAVKPKNDLVWESIVRWSEHSDVDLSINQLFECGAVIDEDVKNRNRMYELEAAGHKSSEHLIVENLSQILLQQQQKIVELTNSNKELKTVVEKQANTIENILKNQSGMRTMVSEIHSAVVNTAGSRKRSRARHQNEPTDAIAVSAPTQAAIASTNASADGTRLRDGDASGQVPTNLNHVLGQHQRTPIELPIDRDLTVVKFLDPDELIPGKTNKPRRTRLNKIVLLALASVDIKSNEYKYLKFHHRKSSALDSSAETILEVAQSVSRKMAGRLTTFINAYVEQEIDAIPADSLQNATSSPKRGRTATTRPTPRRPSENPLLMTIAEVRGILEWNQCRGLCRTFPSWLKEQDKKIIPS